MSGAGRLFRIDTYRSKTDARPAPMPGLQLEEFYALLEHEETDCASTIDGVSVPGCVGKKCPQKDGLAWTAGFIDEACRCGSFKEALKSGRCPECGKRTRHKANVAGLDFAVFDIDHIDPQQVEQICEHLDGVELYLHTTHNHLPPNDQSFRLVLPLSRTITQEEWKQIWFAIVRKFNLPAEVKGHGVDKATRDPARLSFFPRALRGRAFVNVRQPGALLDPKDLLLENIKHSREQLAAPRASRLVEAGVDLDELKARLRKYDPANDPDGDKKALIKRVLDEEPLAEKPGRGFATLLAGSIVGALVPLGTPFESAFEVLRPSYSKIEVLEGDDPDESSPDAWKNQARRGFEKSQEDKETEAIERDDTAGKLIALAKRKRGPKLGPPPPPPLSMYKPPAPLGPPPPVPSVSLRPPAHFPVLSDPDAPKDDSDPDEWREKLITVADKQGLAHPKNTFANLIVVLENHPEWKGVLRYNDLSNEPEASGGPIPTSKRTSNRLITATRSWFAHKEELEMPRFEVVDAVEFVALEHRYDPIREYLTGLTWDGVPRLHDWLVRYCGARLKDDNGLDVTKYVQMVGKKWLMAGAARALYPGCKADNVLVFEGKQYAGKSMMLDILGGEWFVDTRLTLGDKSTLELTTKSWIIELSELASMKKSETDAQKSFFSTRKDSFRLSYARRVEKFGRRCIFAGTTNETRYLLDLTGNRRFWCVWCETLDIAAFRRDRDQLWAEAAAIVRAGETCPNCYSVEERCPEHRWWLDRDETDLAEEIAVTRLKVEFLDEIRGWWFGRKEKPDKLTVKDVLVNILGLSIEKKEQHQAAIGRAMMALGFVKVHLRVPGGREWVYIPNGNLKLAPPPPRVTLSRSDALLDIAEANVPGPKEKQ